MIHLSLYYDAMKKIYLLIYSIITINLFTQSIEIPVNDGNVSEKSFYSLHYNEKFEQANWVAYELTKEEVLGSTKRKDSFKSDPEISSGSATLEDYKGSGYDRGHLAPAADMKMSPESMSESFYMSNMSPQHPSFNRGIWSKLEAIARTWAVENESIYVVTGPVLTKDSYPTIGINNVAVPEYYYKVILDYTGNEFKAIGFILPNEKSTKEIQEYAVTVDYVEQFTGLDFYPLLQDDVEDFLEGQFNLQLWSFNTFKGVFTNASNQKLNKPISTVQYWINSSSNTRHNSSCRYYNNTKNGYFTDSKTGIACNSCGG